MKNINSLLSAPIIVIALTLGANGASAQTATDGETQSILDTIIDTVTGATTDGNTDGEETNVELEPEDQVDGNFSRKIPEGLKNNLSDEEITEYQARLDAATTPQERNEIRRELQRKAKERHLEKVQVKKEEKKGFFETLNEGSKKRKESDARRDKERGGKDGGGKDRGSKDRGGKDRGGKNK